MSLPSVGFWIVHIAGCLAGGALAWGLGVTLHRLLHLSHASRNYWLGIWMLAFMPTIVAVGLELWAPARIASIPAVLPLPVAIEPGDLDVSLAVETTVPLSAWPALNVLLAVVYLGGVGFVLLRGLIGSISVWRIVRSTTPIDPAAWPGAATAMEAQRLCLSGTELRQTQHSMSPFAVRWPRPAIVLPADALCHFNDQQLRLVIRHEAAHLSQCDPQRAGLMKVVGALFWFNPFVRMIAERVQMAAELHCDALALDGNTKASREFAGAYLQTLRMAACGSGHAPVTALTHRDLEGHKMRIGHMLNGDPGRGIPAYLRVAFTGGALIVGVAIAVAQIAMATPVSVPSTDTSSALSLDSGEMAVNEPIQHAVHEVDPTIRFAFPIASPKITGHFGETGSIRSRPHRGTDFGAKRGTPVLAPAAGVVVVATQEYPDGPNYGTVVVLDHGDGWQTLYAHLDSFDVHVGQQVEAGERIARSGRTGKVTGPHLHMEMLLNGQRVDPETLLQ